MGDAALTPPLEDDVDVVIVGGGPTGLLLALLTRELGLSVTVLDSKQGPLEFGRADALNARTQQYLEVSGVLEELLRLGIKCNTTSTYANGRWLSRRDRWFTGLQHCYHKDQLMLGQPAVERALARRALERGVDLRYGETVVASAPATPEKGLTCDKDDIPSGQEEDAVSERGVVVTTERGRTVRARCVVGADGARSTVRRAAGITFRQDVGDLSSGAGMTWAVMDAFVETDFPRCAEIISFELRGRTRVQWIPRERGLARFYALMDEGEEVTLDGAVACIKDHLAPHWVEFKSVEWFSSVRVKERMASSFAAGDRHGQIFLIGDAAHVHSFRGGQGLNTGLADAFALAWRLETLVKSSGLSSESARRLVESYDVERQAIAAGIIELSGGLSRDAVRSSDEYLSRVEKNAGFITGMGVSYQGLKSDLVRESGSGIWAAGSRCPELDLRKPQDTLTQRLYSIVRYGQWVSLAVDKPCEGEVIGRHVAKVRLLMRQEISDGYDGPNDSAIDYICHVDGLEADQVVIVRPDMYIGYVGNSSGAVDYVLSAVGSI